MSVAAIEVGRRVGVHLVGVGMPAHFLVGDPADENWFADAFGGGEVLDRTGCRALFGRATGGLRDAQESDQRLGSVRLLRLDADRD